MPNKTALSVYRWIIYVALCAAIAASAFKLGRAYYGVVHDEGLAALCAAMYAIILAALVFCPKVISAQRRRVASIGIFLVKVYVSFALATLYFANDINSEMVGLGLSAPSASANLDLFPLMKFIVTNVSASRNTGNVVLFAASILLLSFFEQLLEWISSDFDGFATGTDAPSGAKPDEGKQ